MNLETTSTYRNGDAIITLVGELDSLSAPAFRAEIEQVVTGREVRRLVLDMTGLGYLSSAGLRGLVFARQKMPDRVEIVLVGVGGPVEQSIRMVGFHHSVVFSDAIPEAS